MDSPADGACESAFQQDVPEREQQREDDLEEGQSCSGRLVEQNNELRIDLDFQRSKLCSAQGQYDREAQEAEDEYQHRACHEAGHEHRECDAGKASDPARSERLGALGVGGIDLFPLGVHHPSNERSVVERVRQDDSRQGVEDPDRRRLKAENGHQRLIEIPIVAEEEDKADRNGDRRQHKRDDRQRAQRGLEWEAVLREHIRPRQADPNRQQRAPEGLLGGKQDDTQEIPI